MICAFKRCQPWLLFALLSLAVFSPVLVGTYTSDGRIFIERLGPLPPQALHALIQPDQFAPTTGMLSWRPLTGLTMMLLDVRLFHARPLLSHGFTLLWHALNASLLFGLIRRLTPERPVNAWIGALLFLLHPLATEAVLCMGFRADVMAATAILGSAWLALNWQEQGGMLRLIGMAAVFLLGLLTKEITAVALVMIPLLLLLREPPQAGRWGQSILAGSVLCIPMALFGWLWLCFRWHDYPAHFLGGAGRGLGMANAVVVWREEYFARLLWPWPLRNNIPFDAITHWMDPRLLAAAATLALLALVVWMTRRRLALLGGLWYCTAFLPVAQLTPVPDPVAERFCYVPMLGAALFCAGLLDRLSLCYPRTRWWRIGGLALAMLLACLSFRRAQDWHDDLTLNIANWENAGDTSPQALENLGGLYLMQADQFSKAGQGRAAQAALTQARTNLESLLQGNDQHAEGHRLYAVWAASTGHMELARQHAARALALAPQDPQVQATTRALGIILDK